MASDSVPTQTRQWILTKKPLDKVHLDSTFSLQTTALPSLSANQVLVRSLYLSNDPAQRGWIQQGADPVRLYVPPVATGSPMRAYGIGKVVASECADIPKDTLVRAGLGWSEYAVLDAAECVPCQKLDGLSETHYLGALGMTGLTAMYGLEVVRAAKEDVVVVSGAGGATGSMVVQIAKKMLGCKRVIGIAGGEDKCKFVKSLGADACVDYKKDSFGKDLKAAIGGTVDVYFDNVGGEILNRMMGLMSKAGRIAACGAVSNYNAGANPTAMTQWFEIITMRLEIRGFIILDAAPKFPEMTKALIQAYKEGKLVIGEENETVVPADFDGIPEVWMKLFSGANTGKLVTKLAKL